MRASTAVMNRRLSGHSLPTSPRPMAFSHSSSVGRAGGGEGRSSQNGAATLLVQRHLGAAAGLEVRRPARGDRSRRSGHPRGSGRRRATPRCRPAGGRRPWTRLRCRSSCRPRGRRHPPSRSPMMTPASHAMPVAPPPASTNARSLSVLGGCQPAKSSPPSVVALTATLPRGASRSPDTPRRDRCPTRGLFEGQLLHLWRDVTHGYILPRHRCQAHVRTR